MTGDTTQANVSGLPVLPPQTNVSAAPVNLTCSADFYHDTDAGLCRPTCGQWKLYSDGMVIAVKVLSIFAAVAGLALGVAMILLSVLKYRQR